MRFVATPFAELAHYPSMTTHRIAPSLLPLISHQVCNEYDGLRLALVPSASSGVGESKDTSKVSEDMRSSESNGESPVDAATLPVRRGCGAESVAPNRRRWCPRERQPPSGSITAGIDRPSSTFRFLAPSVRRSTARHRPDAYRSVTRARGSANSHSSECSYSRSPAW